MSGGRPRLAVLLRAPLLHYVIAGGILFALRTIAWPESPAEPTHRALSHCDGRDPGSARAFVGATAGAVLSDDEILVREALRLGLDDDIVVQRRLADNLAFLGRTDSRGPIVEELRRTDPIIRRRLAQRMRFHLESTAAVSEPAAGDIAAYVSSRGTDARARDAVSFEQIFFSTERRGGDARADAVALLSSLRDDGVTAAPALGDALHVAVADIETVAGAGRYFGAAFAAELSSMPMGTWLGPIASPFGYHLVRVAARSTPDADTLAAADAGAARQFIGERRRAALAIRLAKLRTAYTVHAAASCP